MIIGESCVGTGANAAHVNTVLGRRDGPVGAPGVLALAAPRAGFAAFVATAQPGVAVIPPTLFVNKAAIDGELHGRLIWGAAQAGVARGVGQALEKGGIRHEQAGGAAPHPPGPGQPPAGRPPAPDPKNPPPPPPRIRHTPR